MRPCPACRLRKRAGFMYAIVGAEKMPVEDAPTEISWPLICMTCGYQDETGYVANPLPVPRSHHRGSDE